MSFRAKIQLANTLCIGVVIYLVNILTLSEAQMKKIDTVLRTIGRAIYSYPDNAPNIALGLEMPFYPASSIITM